MAASYLAPVRVVGVVGGDFPRRALDDLEARSIDLEGLRVVPEGETFRWKGRYHEDMNQRDTLETRLNVFETFSPDLPAGYRRSDYLFLANIQPELQLRVLDQMQAPRMVGLDTMNLWIDVARDDLGDVLRRTDVLLINEDEAKQLGEELSVVRAARAIRAMGPRSLVVKRGEYGALLFHDGETFAAPAFPLEDVTDPTGAGDAFAGGFMGYLARADDHGKDSLRTAMVYGSVFASFAVEGFSYDALVELDTDTIGQRLAAFGRLTEFSRVGL
jgi:sugar/nucleoside kinase (ribokinase family)